MSEKIYLWLWRLYPSHFRDTYREEALQLFRDRARHEKGFFPRLRLWLDILTDIASSVPREYLYIQPALTGVSAQQGLGGTPSFYVQGSELPRLGALLYGGIVSLVIFGSISVQSATTKTIGYQAPGSTNLNVQPISALPRPGIRGHGPTRTRKKRPHCPNRQRWPQPASVPAKPNLAVGSSPTHFRCRKDRALRRDNQTRHVPSRLAPRRIRT